MLRKVNKENCIKEDTERMLRKVNKENCIKEDPKEKLTKGPLVGEILF